MAKKRRRSSGRPTAANPPPLAKPINERIEYHKRVMAAALGTLRMNGGTLRHGCTILFPHRVHGEPPLAAVLTGNGKLAVGGVRVDGMPFTLDPDPSSAALIRADIVKARDRSRREAKGQELDAETGVPVV